MSGCRCAPRTQREPCRDRLALALRDDRLELSIFDRVTGRLPRAITDEDLARRCRRFETRGRVRHISHHRVLPVFGGTDDAGHHLTCADPDMQRTNDAGIGRRRDRRDHLERTPHGALGVVLVRDRCAEDSHDAVPQHVHDRAAEPDDVIAHLPRDVGSDPLDLFRIQTFGQAREPREISEYHGGDPAFLTKG